MKAWPLIAGAAIAINAGLLWKTFSDTDESAESAADSVLITAPVSQALPEYVSASEASVVFAEAAHPASLTPPSNEPDPADATQQDSKTLFSEFLDQATAELAFDAGLSKHNLMVLQDLAIRIQDSNFQIQDERLWQSSNTDWPEALIHTLQRLTASLHAETALRQTWEKTASQNPEAFREALLSQQKTLLGAELFDKLYAEDTMQIDDAGLNAHFASPEDPVSAAHQDKLKLLEKWHQNSLSEADLKHALADSLSNEEIEQLIDTGEQQQAWQNQIGKFLDEYRYIELSGISGEDEQQMRQELLEKHFPAENRLIVNQFLFR